MEHWWNEIDRENPLYSERNLPQCHLSTTNPTWTDPGSNPGLCGERPATNRLSHGTAFRHCLRVEATVTVLGSIPWLYPTWL
jgi:hypothetical protein